MSNLETPSLNRALEDDFGNPWCWKLTKIKKKRICF